MEEKILQTKKNGMTVLLLTLLGFVVDIAAFVFAIRWMEADRMLLGVPVLILAIICGGLILWQHRGNIKRLVTGTESKFYFHKKKKP